MFGCWLRRQWDADGFFVQLPVETAQGVSKWLGIGLKSPKPRRQTLRLRIELSANWGAARVAHPALGCHASYHTEWLLRARNGAWSNGQYFVRLGLPIQRTGTCSWVM